MKYLLLLSLSSACVVTRPCGENSLFVTLTYQGAAAAADTVIVDVLLDGAVRTGSFDVPKSGHGTVEVDFATWPLGETVILRLTAKSGSAIVAFKEVPISITNKCVASQVTLSDVENPLDLGAVGDGRVTPPDLAGVDLTGADLSAVAPADLSQKDSCTPANVTLSAPPPPQVLILLDRSGSMIDSPPDAGGVTKWDEVTSALRTATQQTQDQIDWGLAMFPSDDECGVGATVDVAVAHHNSATIGAAMTASSPNGSTPTWAIETLGHDYLTGLPGHAAKYLLLATDGLPSCTKPPDLGGGCVCPAGYTTSGSDCCISPNCFPCASVIPSSGDPAQQAIDEITQTAADGIGTFVLGVVAESLDQTTLSSMATAGQHPRSGSPSYYPVGSQAEVLSAVNAIATQIVGCVYPLPSPPADASHLAVLAGSLTVPRDTTHANGWDFGNGNQSIVFYGGWCSTVQSGTIASVQALYSCP